MTENQSVNVENSDNNPLVLINLDRPRFVKFGHKALKQLTKLTNINLDKMDNSDFDLAELEKVMWCGLQADARENGEDLKIEDMEDLLDHAESFGDIMDAMNEALAQAFKKTTKEKN